MEWSTVKLNKQYLDEKMIVLSLNRPKRLNAINDKLVMELNKALDYAEREVDIEVVIITSESMKAFCAGIDVSYIQTLSNEAVATFFEQLAELLERIIHFPKLTIAAVYGYAYGGGADLALACDLRIASVHSSYRFPGPQFGLVLGTKRLIAEVGASKARSLTLTNERLGADKALQYALIHEVFEEEEVLKRAVERGRELVRVPEYAVKTIKQLTSNEEQPFSPVELTKESVMATDFKPRFASYLERMKKR